MKNIIRYSLILIILVILFIMLIFYKSKNNVFDDIMIFSLWDNLSTKKEYEISSKNVVEIDVFTTTNNKRYKKIAPGSSGSFVIKFKRPAQSSYEIRINEKTSKPQNLIFLIGNEKYSTLEEMENVINEKFINTDQITIKWEWKYCIDDIHDIQDTKDGKQAKKYIFEISAIVEKERNET